MAEHHGHEKPMQELLHWLEKRAIPSYDISTGAIDTKRTFIPLNCVETYFQEFNYNRTRRLLKVFFPGSGGPSAKDVAEICPRIFCILATMEMEVVQYIGTFVSTANLSDARLPFEDKPRRFPIVPGDEEDRFWDEFKVKQWRFCAPVLKSKSAYEIEDDFILPFTELQRAGGGGSATVYKATVQQAHDELTHPDAARPGNIYALKTFRPRTGVARDYERELDAFKRITESGTRTAHGIIKFYSSFQYMHTFILVLEYADGGTLEDYLHNKRPADGADIIDFWESLFATLQALFRIHQNHLPPDENGEKKLLQGFHQDLKPKNILVVKDGHSPYRWLFKIADFGLSHFRTIMEGQPEASDLDTFGTKTYGAPECYAPHDSIANWKNNVKRSVDIWSLGGIYSEVAAWVVDGLDCVDSYRRKRKVETDSLSDFRDGNCFHNGRARLSAVDQQHAYLKRRIPDWDFITGKVLDNMIIEMLEFEPGTRPTAEQLVGKAKRLVADAREALQHTTIGTPPQQGQRQLPSPPRSPEADLTRERAYSEQRQSVDHDRPGTIFSEPNRYVSSPQTSTIFTGFSSMNPADAAFSTVLPMHVVDPSSPSTLRPHVHAGSFGGIIEEHSGEQIEEPATPFTSAPRPEPPPFCSVKQAQEWYTMMKYGNKTAKLPYQDELMWQLKDRDHVFVIDDSISMKTHWTDVASLVLLLAYITKRMDPDKLELFYLTESKPHHFRSSADLAKHVKDHKADKMTNLNTRMDADLQSYIQAIDKSRSSGSWSKKPTLHPRSIYILSDGAWELGTDDQGYNSIRAMTEKLAKLNYPRTQIGIQLIRFGDRPDGIRRMEALDNLSSLLRLNRDIVDTEPHNGNVWKMLLGAINEKFDGDERPVSHSTVRTSGT